MKKSEKGDEIENLTWELEGKTPCDKMGYAFMGAFVACVVICVLYVWFNADAIFGATGDFVPRTAVLEDAFVSSGDSAFDGQHLFDFEGYMKKNGFKKEYVVCQDETLATIVAEVFTKDHAIVRLRVLRTYSAETGGCTMVESAVMIHQDTDPEGHFYVATYTDDPSVELVYDDDSALVLSREALDDLDLVLKSGNLDNVDICPFAGLEIVHKVADDGGLLPHID